MIPRLLSGVVLCLFVCAFSSAAVPRSVAFQQTIRDAQRRTVKIYGAGGLRQMEAYQSGLLISEDGYIITALSYVLDTDDLVATLDDGRRLPVEIVGSDPVSELAVLKPKEDETGLPHFNLSQGATAREGQRVLALSNLYGIATGNEPTSVQQGVVMAIAPLDARRGAQRTPYRGSVYVLDAQTNNPGAAGGALVDWQGRLVGVLGKELRSRVTGTWLNYALPAEDVRSVVADIKAKKHTRSSAAQLIAAEKPLSSEVLGFVLVPDVLQRTPPYIDSVDPNSSAGAAGMQTDDLVVFVDDRPIASCRELRETLFYYESSQQVSISILRDGTLLAFELVASVDSSVSEGEQEEAVEP